MSNISTTHTVSNFDAKKSQPLTGQRLAKIIFKNTEKVKAPMPSKCVSVPFLTSEQVDEVIPAIKAHIVSMLEGAQNELIRAKLLEFGEGTEIADSDISLAACISYLDEAAKGNRLSKDSIAAWFAGNVAELLAVAIADKLGISDTPTAGEVEKLEKIISDYSAKFQALAGSKTMYSPDVAQKLVRALEVTGCNDPLAQQFTVKLQAMKTVPAADLLGL